MPLSDPRDDFSTLFEFLPIGAYRSSPQGRQLRANQALARLNGFQTEAEQLAAVHDIGRGWYVAPNRREEFKREMALHGRVLGFESEICRYKTRERIWISENAHVVRGVDGEAMYYEGTVEEITQRVRDREALIAKEEQLRQIMEMVPGVVYRVLLLPDGGRRATFVSGGARELLGVEPEAILADGKLVHRMRHPEDRARIEAETTTANGQRLPLQTEFRIVLPSGQVKWVQAMSAPAPQAEGCPVRIGVIVDITAAKQAESLRLERDRAAAADLAKSQFMSRVSHELRTPMNAVLGFAQLLELELATGGSERQRGWLRHVLTSGRHLLRLLDDVLALSSAQTGQLPMMQEAVLLGAVVQAAMDMLAAEAHAGGVAVIHDLPSAPRLAVRGDRKRLLQIVTNLLSNAIKYNRRGGWVRIATQLGPNGVELSVADNGPGLDEAQRQRLFQPFERLGAQSGPVAGSGLGLALSRQLAEAMGGSISVHSELGQGAVFTLRLQAA